MCVTKLVDFPAVQSPSSWGFILMPIIIPWGYVYRHYIKQPSDRCRRIGRAILNEKHPEF